MEAAILSRKLKTRVSSLKRNYEQALHQFREEQLPLWNYRFSQSSATWRKLKNRYAGQRCFIIGNGPSLKSQDLTLLKDEITFVTNWFVLHEDYEKINPTYHCICAHEVFGGWRKDIQFDPKLYQLLKEKTRQTTKVFPFFFESGIKAQELFTDDEVAYLLYGPKVQEIHQVGHMNLDIASQRMYMGHTVISIFCLPIAHYLGFKEIYLLGCDCDYGVQQPSDQRGYFYESAQHSTKAPDFEWLKRSWAADGPMIQAYAVARHEFEKSGRVIYNATAGGRLEVFPRVNFEDLFK